MRQTTMCCQGRTSLDALEVERQHERFTAGDSAADREGEQRCDDDCPSASALAPHAGTLKTCRR
ncbi:MAG: hypothetical protein ABIZ18_07395 [Caldimonas sp.]